MATSHLEPDRPHTESRRIVSLWLLLVLAVTLLAVLNACSSPPVAQMSASPASGPAPLTVALINGSKNADEFRWDFGDGATAVTNDVSQQATHEYTKAGTYTVTLGALKKGKADQSSTTSLTVTVTPGQLSRVVLAKQEAMLPPWWRHTGLGAFSEGQSVPRAGLEGKRRRADRYQGTVCQPHNSLVDTAQHTGWFSQYA